MKKKGESRPALENNAAPAHSASGDHDSCTQQSMVMEQRASSETPLAPPRNRPLPRSYRELGEGIFGRHHPVDVGCEVIEKSEDRGAATKLQALKTYAGWAFGEPDAEGHRKPPRIIWDIPGPPYEPQDPELLAAGALEDEKLEGGEK